MAHDTDRPILYHGFRYEDPDAAIAWLDRAFGFQPHAVFRDDHGRVMHAELDLGGGAVIMLGLQREDSLGTRTPRQAGGVTSTVYGYVPDPDALHARATAAGAEIVRPLQDTGHGSREFTVRDPEGHVWSFGNYRPAAKPAIEGRA